MLTTKRLYLRPFTTNDLDYLSLLHSNPEVAKSTIDGVQSIEVVKKHLDDFIQHQKEYGFSQWAVFEKNSEKFVGRAGFTFRQLDEEFGKQVEIRFAILPDFWGQGLASELASELMKYAFEVLKVSAVAAGHGKTNYKSEKILAKIGFIFVKSILPEGFSADKETRYYLLTRARWDELTIPVTQSSTPSPASSAPSPPN